MSTILTGRKIFIAACALAAVLLLWTGVTAALIVNGSRDTAPPKADVAIVLGAAVRGNTPSPVFAERIRHGITLYKSGRVRYLLFTGGYGEGARHAESQVGRDMALAADVPADAILVETRSHTTYQNIIEAKAIMRPASLRRAIIVTDPLHSYRALQMAHGEGINATGSPTPTTRYRSFSTKADFMAREIFYTNVYWVAGR